MTLIAAEIDIDVPTMEKFDIISFLKETEEIYKSPVESVYKKRNNRIYPWTRRVISFQGEPIYSLEKYIELNTVFELAKILITDPTVIMIHQEKQSNYDFDWHTDQDSPYGYRLCYGLDTNQPFIELSKLKNEYIGVIKRKEKVFDHMIEDRIYTFTPLRQNTLVQIEGDSYVHRVPIIESSERLVFIIIGEPCTCNHKYLQIVEEKNEKLL